MISVGDVKIGNNMPVSIQSMTNTDTRDVSATLRQIRKLHVAGCEIVRVAVPDIVAAESLSQINAKSPLPVIADIHFDAQLALLSIKNGAKGIRINPGNIGGEKAVAKIAKACNDAGIPIRVGANSGSLIAKFANRIRTCDENKKSEIIADALIESALSQCRILEKHGFHQIKVSLKASDVLSTIIANRKFSERYDYPLHLGITEAGGLKRGMLKSAVGIGTLLLSGIGDTIRVSLTGNPIEEVKAAIMILEATGIRKACPEIVSCPTCGRTEVNLEKLVIKVEKQIDNLKKMGYIFKPAKIAIMGCAVNGPGEAKDADIGLSGAKDAKLLLFEKGRIIGSYGENEAFAKFASILKTIYASPKKNNS